MTKVEVTELIVKDATGRLRSPKSPSFEWQPHMGPPGLSNEPLKSSSSYIIQYAHTRARLSLSPRTPNPNLAIFSTSDHDLAIPIDRQQPLPRSTSNDLVILPRVFLDAKQGLFRGSDVPDLKVTRVGSGGEGVRRGRMGGDGGSG